jgi:hypothetical protein
MPFACFASFYQQPATHAQVCGKFQGFQDPNLNHAPIIPTRTKMNNINSDTFLNGLLFLPKT